MIVARGPVSDRPFARTIYAIAARRFTGDLFLHDAGRRYAIAWDNGAVVGAESAAPADSAGRVGLTAGLVNSTAVARSLQLMIARKGVEQIDILAELARLSPEHVASLRRLVLAQRAARAFALPDAHFELDDARTVKAEPVAPLDPRWLIFHGVRSHYDEARLDRELASLTGRAVGLAADAFGAIGAFGFGDADRPVLAALRDHALVLDDLVHIAGKERRAVLAVVYALGACDCLAISPASSVAGVRRPEASGPLSAAAATRRPGQTAAPEAEMAGGPTRPERVTNPGSGRGHPSTAPTTPAPSATTPPPRAPTVTSEPGRAGGVTGPPARARASTASAPPARAPTSSAPPAPRPGTSSAPPARRPGTSSGPLPRSRTSTLTASRAGTTISPPVRERSPSPSTPVPLAAAPSASGRTRPNPTTLSPGDAAANEARTLILDKLQSVDSGATHFTVLGATSSATPAEIRSAYFALAKRLHPDRLRAVGVVDMVAESQRLFAAINQAFAVLSDPAKRTGYEAFLSSGGAAKGKEDAEAEALVARIFGAEDAFRKGEMALRRNQFAQARAFFEEAATLGPDDAEHQAMLAWSIWITTDDKQAIYADVQRRLNTALKLSDACVPAFFYRGLVAKQAGKDDLAIQSFRQVLDLRPSHPEAALELRLLVSRTSGRRRGDSIFGGKRK